MKPAIVAAFLEKHPGKPLSLSDADALVTGDLALRPTHQSSALVEEWRRACETAPYGDTYESQLAAALPFVEGLRIVNLHYQGELGGLIRHDSASKGARKASHLTRLIAKPNPRG